MDKPMKSSGKFFIVIILFIFIFCIIVKTPKTYRSIPNPRGPPKACPYYISEQTITPLNNTKHFQVSAYMDQRVKGLDIRIIGIFRRDSIQPLHCLFCCADYVSSTTTPATILQHPDNFGFPFVTTDVMCRIPQNCNATHVTLQTQPGSVTQSDQIWLPIKNKKTNRKEEEKFQFNFTVCISNLFGDYNNVLQFAQTLEMYRSMTRSRYVLLNDIDEIIMPYQHNNLMSLMNVLQQQKPNAAVFLIENHIFPKIHFEPSGKFHLPQWNGVPGINILEHIYREEPNRNIYHPYKMIVQPRLVEQTSVHELLKNFGQRYKVPPDVCRIIHVRVPLQGRLTREQLHVDKRLWDFHEKLIPSVDKALKRVGLLGKS
ncbi:uncharacterized protein LOC111225302 isoform X2 [Seriola dumerili]|uniref:uncharacterized protein LOC111225302 isoform X2 n=1 Tax=Seriola dumerili TaxID=41447 RepID=UPI000BBE814B|nr:uncharacterized protein LOC111225302 isoform X2 [Seriola dumerili]